MVRISDAHKSFGNKTVLRGVDGEIRRGECVAVLGKNGAGKSTLLRAIASVTPLDRGRIEIAGIPAKRELPKYRAQIGYLGHASLLSETLTAWQNLYYYGRFYGIRDLDRKIDESLRSVHLHFVRDEAVRTFSRGMIRKLSIVRCMLHDPPVYLLDEPFAGLDSSSTRALIGVLAEKRRKGKAVVLVTHNLDHALDLADTIWFLNAGRIDGRVAAGSLELCELRAAYGECIEGLA